MILSCPKCNHPMFSMDEVEPEDAVKPDACPRCGIVGGAFTPETEGGVNHMCGTHGPYYAPLAERDS